MHEMAWFLQERLEAEMTHKPYPTPRRELRQAEIAWRRDSYVRGYVPKRTGWPLWARAVLLVIWAVIVANGIGAVLGLYWRHP